MFEVGEAAFVCAGLVAAADFFFLILIPGTGAEFRASRNPVPSIAVVQIQDVNTIIFVEHMLRIRQTGF